MCICACFCLTKQDSTFIMTKIIQKCAYTTGKLNNMSSNVRSWMRKKTMYIFPYIYFCPVQMQIFFDPFFFSESEKKTFSWREDNSTVSFAA